MVLVYAIVRVDIAEEMRAVKRIFVKWYSFPVHEVDRPLFVRCYKCMGQHVVGVCKQIGQTCANCGHIGHIQGECREKTCWRDCATIEASSDHRLQSKGCPVYKDKVNRMLNNNGYGG